MAETKLNKKERADMQKLINLVLNTPISKKDGPIVEVDGERSFEEFKKAPVDIKTRIVLQMAADAMKGDARARGDILKYGGFEPIKEQAISLELPTIVDDMGNPVKEEAAEKFVESFIPDEIYDDNEESQ